MKVPRSQKVPGTFLCINGARETYYTYQFFRRRLDPGKAEFSVWSDRLYKVFPLQNTSGSSGGVNAYLRLLYY